MSWSSENTIYNPIEYSGMGLYVSSRGYWWGNDAVQYLKELNVNALSINDVILPTLQSLLEEPTIADITPILNNIQALSTKLSNLAASMDSLQTNLQDNFNIDISTLFNGEPVMDAINMPTKPADVTLNAITKPTLDTTINLPSEPSINYPAAPSEPSITYPTKPTLSSITIPDVPSLNLPSDIITNFPNIPDAPDTSTVTLNNYNEDNYSDKIDTLINNIKTLMDGGNDTDLTKLEADMIKRVYNQIEEDYRKEEDNLRVKFDKMGYTLPFGYMTDAMLELRKEMLSRRAEALGKIQEALSEMNIKNRQIGINAGVDLEKAHISLFNEKMGRRLQYYLAEIDKLYKDFEAKLKKISIYFEQLNIDIATRKYNIEKELTKLEQYKYEIEKEKLVITANSAEVEMYKAELEAIQAKASVYEATVKAYMSKVQAEMGKIEVYKAKVEAAMSKIEVAKAQVSMYEAEIGAEKAKADMYESQMKAYATAIQAEMTKVEKYKMEMEAFITKVNSKLEISKVRAEMSLNTQRLKAEILNMSLGIYNLNLDIYKTKTNSILTLYQDRLTQYASTNDARLRFSELQIKKVAQQLQKEIESSRFEVDRVKTLGQLCATLSAAVYNMYSASINDNYNKSESKSESKVEQSIQSVSI